MNRSQAWILGAACGCFLAGVAAGLALPGVFTLVREAAASDPDEDYVRKMIADYELDAEQARLLRIAIRTAKEDELRLFHQAQVTQLPPELQNRLRDVRSRLVQRTRKILESNPRQLERYDSMVAAEGSR